MRLKSDDAIRIRFGPHRYPNPFSPGTFAYESENATNAMRELWSEVLILYVRALRRLPFFS